MKNLVRTISSVLGVVLMAAATSAHAESYPDRPIRVVIPFTPGAAADLVIRTLQPLLQKQLGQPLVIDYKTGAGGAIAVQEVARAAPDGYTLLMVATNNLVIDQFMQARPTLDPLTALIPIVKLVEVPAVLFASKGMGVRTWAEFKSKAMAPGTQINFSSPGIGTTPHLSSLLLGKEIGVNFTHIPYRGGQAAIQALLADDVQFYMGNFRPLAQFVEQGRATALAVVSPQRLAGLPDVPTTGEAGIPNVVTNNWFALVAPSGTPDPIVRRILAEVQVALDAPDIRKKFVDSGFAVSGVGGQVFLSELDAETRKWRALIASEKLARKE